MTASPARISAADANRHFSKLLGRVRAGEEVVITSRGKPVARLVPSAPDERAEAKRQERVRRLFHRLRTQPGQPFLPYDRDELYDDI